MRFHYQLINFLLTVPPTLLLFLCCEKVNSGRLLVRVLQASEGYSENKTMTEVGTKMMKENKIGRPQWMGRNNPKEHDCLGRSVQPNE